MITPEDYAFLSDMLKKHSGLALGPGKEYLIESRLPPVAVTYGFADVQALILALRRAPAPPMLKHVCDAMTTNETLFFRDSKSRPSSAGRRSRSSPPTTRRPPSPAREPEFTTSLRCSAVFRSSC
jgi:hypothetical protein